MASQPNSWWSRPIATHPYDRKATCTESIACYSPCYTGIFTVFSVFYIFLLIDQTLSHVKFSTQSINVSVSSDLATWHVDFLVKNPIWSTYSIYYDDDVSVRLGPLKAIVLNISHRRESRDVTASSLAFVAEEGNRNEEQLYLKLRGKHERYVHYNEAGHFDVQCQNFTRNHEKKIICQSSFTPLNMVTFRPLNRF